MKRLFVTIATLLMVLCMAPSLAAAYSVDLSADVNLTVDYHNGTDAIPGATFKLYKVADVDPNVTSFTLNSDAHSNFAAHAASIPDMTGLDVDSWNELALTLKGYAVADGMTPVQTGTTAADGKLSFPTSGTLKPGLYLLIGNNTFIGSYMYSCTPSMIFLPGIDRTVPEWIYTGNTVSPKNSKTYIPPAPPVDPPDDPPEEPEKISREVMKVWKDSGHTDKRPDSIIVNLYRDGSLYDTQKLDKNCGWKHVWNDLDPEADWVVSEVEVKQYKTVVSLSGITFTIRNTYDPDEDYVDPIEDPDDPGDDDDDEKEHGKIDDDDDRHHGNIDDDDHRQHGNIDGDDDRHHGEKLPQTGMLWWPIPVLGGSGLTLLGVGLFMKRKRMKIKRNT